GIEVSQKAHSALRWLIGRQGYVSGDHVIVAWNPRGKKIPAIALDSEAFLSDDEPATESDKKAPAALEPSVGQAYALKLRRKLAGYQADLAPDDSVCVLELDSQVPGRIAINYYREFTS